MHCMGTQHMHKTWQILWQNPIRSVMYMPTRESKHIYSTSHSYQKPGRHMKTSHVTAARNLTTAPKHHMPQLPET